MANATFSLNAERCNCRISILPSTLPFKKGAFEIYEYESYGRPNICLSYGLWLLFEAISFDFLGENFMLVLCRCEFSL